jgi:diketogulonate reductase-like aldo/keto reductase
MNLNARLNSGWEIPLFGLGTYKTSDQDSVDKAIDSALGCGYRNFDTGGKMLTCFNEL